MASPHHHALLFVNDTHAGRSRCGETSTPAFQSNTSRRRHYVQGVSVATT